jgi:hypothetical protein
MKRGISEAIRPQCFVAYQNIRNCPYYLRQKFMLELFRIALSDGDGCTHKN